METVFSMGFTLCSVLVYFLIDTANGLTCDEYDDQACRANRTDAACRVVSQFCPIDQLDATCFAFWKETPDGKVVIQKKGCWHAEQPRCSQHFCANDRQDHLKFCCCTGNNCNADVLRTNKLPRPANTVELLWHQYKWPETANAPGRRPGFPVSVIASNTSNTLDTLNTLDASDPSSIEGPSITTNAPPVEPVPLSMHATLVVGTIVLSFGVVVLAVVVVWRYYRSQLQDGKKPPFDLESALVMAPLMSKEYENQDGSLLLKNLQLLERKAMGRYGEVWKGRLGDTVVAVKITPGAEVASWKNEVHIYHKFLMLNGHPNVLRFILSGHKPTEGRMFLVTEYHSVGSLAELLKGRVITNEEAERVMCSLLAGVAFLHDADGKAAIAHRDFKSTNVLIKADRTACIADFGLATSFEADERIGDKHGQVGTRRYMAPELLEGAISLNVVSFLRVDVYACGLVLWEVLSRTQLTPEEVVGIFKLPLEEELGTSPTNEAVQTAVVHKRLRPSFKSSWKTNPRNAGLCQTIEECWDADPEARPSASCLLNRMRQLSAGTTVLNECERSVYTTSAYPPPTSSYPPPTSSYPPPTSLYPPPTMCGTLVPTTLIPTRLG